MRHRFPKWPLVCAVSLALSSFFATSAFAEPYPDEVRESFLAGCAEQSSKPHCDCVLARLEAEVPLPKLIDGSLEDATIDGFINDCMKQVETDEWPDEMVEAFMAECGQSSSEAVCTCVMSKLKGEIPARTVLSDGVPEGRLEELVTLCEVELAPAVEPPPESVPLDGASDDAAAPVAPEE